MPLSWNEIKTRAAAFVLEWKDNRTVKEKAEAQSFEIEFLKIFGVDRKKVALFEHEVRFENGERGYIDLFWKGKIIIEMKTPGKDLGLAYEQAKAYALTLPQKDIPKGILTCDFLNFQYYDLEDDGKCYVFPLEELPEYVELFGYLSGYKEIDPFKHWDPVNIEAAVKMGELHNRLKEIGYSGHQLELYLVRLMFCLFADDTGIFEPPNLFNRYIMERTSEDGCDLALHIQKIFETLNKSKDRRLKTIIDEQLNLFPWVNGQLFEEQLETADFDRLMRDTLIECCALDWSKISPAIFGAMFQSVMNDEERHDIGAYYTSEENILKLIRPLFLDSLHEEFNSIKKLSPSLRRERLIEFHDRLASLKFLDPACGCGNFLVISYRELRLLELDILEVLLGKEQVLDVQSEIKVNVNQFYGIEIEEFPAQIAQVALWLVDHQMNLLVRERFGTYYIRIPLTIAASIHYANALTLDWESVIPKNELTYILGNPPFLGARVMSKKQKSEVNAVFDGMKNSGNLDYVTCWYKKAVLYIQGTEIECAFVSTNSICQGEQVPILWPELMNKHNIKINFAHQTFKWSNEARGKAAVYCVIIGFALADRDTKKIYQYATVTSKPTKTAVKQINAYLVNAPLLFIQKRNKPLCGISEMVFGNMPNDDGNFLLTEKERKVIIKENPEVKKIIKPFIGADEFINNIPRYCLWLKDVSPSTYRESKAIMSRIKNVRNARMKSDREATRKLAEFPTLFGEIRQPDTNYLLIPRVSSERRKYIPIGFMNKNVIAGDSTMVVPKATLYEFGVLTSSMHMAWVRYVCGRLKSDYRYSASIVYNNYHWPSPSAKQRKGIETAAQGVLDARKKYPDLSLATLYDNNTMIPELVKAHQKLNKAVEAAYGRSFENASSAGTDSQRVAYLFELYQKLSGELFAEGKKKGRGR
jgi:hypothetical protein